MTALHQNAQRLLRPLEVLNPYAQFLTFPDQTTRLRRDHEKYLTLIDVIAFVHQHQRALKTAQRGEQRIEYIEATLADIERANHIAHDVLGRSLDDLPPQTRRLLALIDGHVSAECRRTGVRRIACRFTRRALREAIDWGDTQLKVHLARLVELEYLVAHRAKPGSKVGGFEYELVYDLGADEHTLRFPGLADINAIKKARDGHAYDGAWSEQNEPRSAPGRGLVGPQSVGSRGSASAAEPASMRVVADGADDQAEQHFLTPRKRSSYKVKRHMEFAGVHKLGSAHLLRHACATHMLEGGADIRFIQEMLGHANIETTEIYTHVSIDKLIAVHGATHPSRLQRRRTGAGGDETPVSGPSLDEARETLLRSIEADGDDSDSLDERAPKSAPADASRRR